MTIVTPFYRGKVMELAHSQPAELDLNPDCDSRTYALNRHPWSAGLFIFPQLK